MPFVYKPSTDLVVFDSLWVTNSQGKNQRGDFHDGIDDIMFWKIKISSKLIHHMSVIEFYLRFYPISNIWIPYRTGRLSTAIHPQIYRFFPFVLFNYFRFHFGPLFKTPLIIVSSTNFFCYWLWYSFHQSFLFFQVRTSKYSVHT